jgi:hypothetical protein
MNAQEGTMDSVGSHVRSGSRAELERALRNAVLPRSIEMWQDDPVGVVS